MFAEGSFSSNTLRFDEAYSGSGRKDLAIESYENALRLDPHDQNAAESLRNSNAIGSRSRPAPTPAQFFGEHSPVDG